VKRDNDSGNAIVEFALVLPILALLLVGMLQFGIAFYDKAVMTNAAREAARFGIIANTPRANAGAIIGVASTYCAGHLINFAGGGAPVITVPQLGNVTGDPLTVTIQYSYKFLNLVPIQMDATTVMRLE
jgi:Flp pilus assembly protein TadG